MRGLAVISLLAIAPVQARAQAHLLCKPTMTCTTHSACGIVHGPRAFTLTKISAGNEFYLAGAYMGLEDEPMVLTAESNSDRSVLVFHIRDLQSEEALALLTVFLKRKEYILSIHRNTEYTTHGTITRGSCSGDIS